MFKWVQLVGAMVFIGLVDWAAVLLLRGVLKYVQRAFFRARG